MSRALSIVVILIGGVLPSLRAQESWAASGVPSHIEHSLPIRADVGARAVTYVTDTAAGKQTQDLAVVVGSGRDGRVVWRHPLPEAASRLVSEGPADVFTVLGASSGLRRFVGAYRVSGDVVHSAVAGATSGLVEGNRGADLRDGGFVVLRADASHSGSVPYRLRLRYGWSDGAYRKDRTSEAPDLPDSAYPTPNALIHAASGSTVLLRLWVAADAASQDKGLMFVDSMNPDQGMVFTWAQDVHESFWMENTYIPLTVAFVSAQGDIQEMQDMDPLTTDYHTPALPYRFAIEANKGYFAQFGVRVGDHLVFHLVP